MNSRSVFVKNVHIFMSVLYEHTPQFCYTADWGQFSSSDTQYYNLFFLKKYLIQ